MLKRFLSLRKFYEEYGLDYVRSRDAKDLITKAHLYELRPFLKENMWNAKIDPMGSYTDKISGYWKITLEGLSKLQELYPNDENLIDRISDDIRLMAKKVLAN